MAAGLDYDSDGHVAHISALQGVTNRRIPRPIRSGKEVGVDVLSGTQKVNDDNMEDPGNPKESLSLPQ
eukprot:CAMPEP_0184746112 /NCGR_PEP_ID=MMETSP0315-20130426/8661_1 /TAXON_ID=101924 /ORGANISM="Rhodosorus marinus, Strain UTEX LB 2760" /LENGTH=67 /DNA_ID=CAMNT_0027218499 /DNA_START=849 /DNA_END=1052 /DNA_ORIENTATION=+